MRARTTAAFLTPVLATALVLTASPTTAAPSAGSAPAARSALGDKLTKKQIKAARLKASELPSGWKKVRNSGGGDFGTVEPAACETLMNSEGDGTELRSSEVSFENKRLGDATLTVDVTTHRDTFERRKFQAELNGLLDSCGAFTATDGGVTFAGSIKSISFPRIKAYTKALRMRIGTMGIVVVGDIVMVAKGHNLITVTTVSLMRPVPKKQLKQIVRAAVKKVEKAAA